MYRPRRDRTTTYVSLLRFVDINKKRKKTTKLTGEKKTR